MKASQFCVSGWRTSRKYRKETVPREGRGERKDQGEHKQDKTTQGHVVRYEARRGPRGGGEGVRVHQGQNSENNGNTL